MKKLYSISLAVVFCCISQTSVRAQEYAVGVFYMPFWHNIPAGNGFTYPAYYPVQPHTAMLESHHWGIMADFHNYMILTGQTGSWDNYRKISTPSSIWYHGNLNDLSTLSPAEWYNENIPYVTSKQLELMNSNEIDFVIYDAFFFYNSCCGNNSTFNSTAWRMYWDGPIQNWLSPGFNNHGVEMALYWAADFSKLVIPTLNLNGTITGGNPNGLDGFFGAGQGLESVVDQIAQFMNLNGKYKTKNGKNLLYIDWARLYAMMDIQGIENIPFFSGHNSGNDPVVSRMAHFLNQMKIKLLAETQKGTYLVAVTSEPTTSDQDNWDYNGYRKDWMISKPIDAGFDAITTYTYKVYEESDRYVWGQVDPNGIWADNVNYNYSYNTMKDVYDKNYNYYLNTHENLLISSGTKYQVPVTAGWNRSSLNMREAGGEHGNQYPQQPHVWLNAELKNKNFNTLKSNQFRTAVWDNAISTPIEFQGALTQAKTWIDQNSNRTDNTVILCCWNEHAEGTVIEPTFAWGDQYLQKVKSVFQTTSSGGGTPPGNGKGGPIPMVGRPVIPESDFIPESLSINQNFPNPFRERTTLTYGLPSDGRVQIQIYNSSNQLITTLIDEEKSAGVHEAIWEASGQKKGVYFFQIKHRGQVQTKKMILID